jgi:NADPH:quinone reductase-like Zn-dependent oxidoreductase/3-oxoacyl-(acyl-carrier-protein) synthase/NADP-dependent 3-hydroxy acid dehydrogenase YdfG/acyl carrier protein
MEEEGALPNVARVLASDIEEDGWWVSETGVKVPRLIDVPLPPARFQPRHGTWVITGGRGALGLHVARFLAEKGASHLRLSGRSEPSQEDRVAFEALRTLGAHVEYVTSDVHVEKDVENLLKADPPVVGIVHAAGVLDDHSILHLNRGHLDRAGQAKIIGTQHLVRYVQAHDLPLQALVWFSSLAGVCGSPGQGNYAAANAYLDALSSTLRAQGLPSLSIAWGPWAGGGMALDTAQRRSEEGIQPMDPSPALQAMEALLTDAPSSVCVADVDWSAAAQRFARVPSLIRERVGDAQTTRSNLSSNQVEAMVSRVLGIPIPVPKNRGFADLGMDSVQGLELARALGKQLGEPLPPTLAWDHPTLEALADHLTEKTAKTSEAAPPIVGATQAGIDLMGWALRVPGASSAEELWQNWMAGTSTMRPFPDDRFQGNDWADIQPPEKGGFLDGVDLFDAEHFGISAREASTLDPQQRLLLELTWEALLDAGLDPDDTRGRSIGVFLSMGGSDYAHLLGKAGLLATEPHAGSGNDPAFAAGRIAHTFGWTGPALVVQTACPGGLAALNMAARALDDGSCELALVGGVHLSLSPEPFAYQSRIEALSPDGETRSFLADANGYGRSEGAAVVVVRPAGGDSPSYGTLLGSAIEHVGASASLTAPSGPPQESVALRALQQAGVNAGDIGYIEAHGTARPTSDAIEIGALSSVYGDPENSPAIGTIKTIVGHTETASGLVGTIAACLVAHHQTVPGHPFKGPAGAHLKGQGLDLSPQTRPMQGLVAIHAYGLSGTVAHAVLRAGARAPGPSPSLPFSRRRWWYTRSSRPGRRLPGSICVWERVLLPSEGLGDHRIGNEVVVPATEWVAWVLEACASVERPTQLMDVTFCAPTTLSDNGRTAQLSFLPGDRWQISVASDNGWIVAAHGGLTSGGALSSPPSLPTPKRSTDALYTAFQNTGQDYGPRFALLDKLHLGEDPTRASATLKGGALEGLLDAGLQLRAALAEPGAALVPFSIDRVIATGSLDSLSSVVLEVEGDEDETWISHIWWCNPQGVCVLEMEGQASRTVGGQDRRLMIPTDGVLDHLYWGPHESPEPLEDEVRIEVHAAGLNFRDVLAALGAYPGPSHPLGAECVGVVESCGPLATLQPGQRVMAFGPGTMASRVTLPAAGVIGLPETIHDVEAATLPVVFLTAWVALREVAQLKEGETILIHAAAGGVGMAAVQIARLLGARVFGTAHPRKWDSLKDQGVTQMASSRDPAFSNEFTEPVDVVLNSLTGPFIDASIQLLRPGGRFVELGKRDLRSPEAFPKTCTYTPFDIGVWGQSDPKALQQAMAEILQHIEAGELRPLPYRVFPFAQATQAFRHLAEAAHIGKVVLTRSEVQEGPTERTSTLPPDRSGVQRFVASLVAEVLGLSEPPELHRPLKELGMDSLLAIELRNRLSNLSGQAFPATLVFTHPTTQALIDRLAPAPDEDGLSEEELLAALDEELKDL